MHTSEKQHRITLASLMFYTHAFVQATCETADSASPGSLELDHRHPVRRRARGDDGGLAVLFALFLMVVFICFRSCYLVKNR